MNTNEIMKLEKDFDPDTLSMMQSIRSNIVERTICQSIKEQIQHTRMRPVSCLIRNTRKNNGASIGEYYYHKFGADFFRIYGLALDYADKRKIPVNVALGYTLHRLKLLRHGLHTNKEYALDKLEELQGGNFSNRNLKVHDDISDHENTIEYDSIKEVNNNLNVQALLKNLFLDYTYARRSKIINTMQSNFMEQKKILSKDQLYKMSRRLEKITGAKSRIKPELLAVIFERNIEFIGGLI